MIELNGMDTVTAVVSSMQIVAASTSFATPSVTPTAGVGATVITAYGIRTATTFSAEAVNSSTTNVNERTDTSVTNSAGAMATLEVASTSGSYSGTATPGNTSTVGTTGILIAYYAAPSSIALTGASVGQAVSSAAPTAAQTGSSTGQGATTAPTTNLNNVLITGASVAQASTTGGPVLRLSGSSIGQSASTGTLRLSLAGSAVGQALSAPPALTLRITGSSAAQRVVAAAVTLALGGVTVGQASTAGVLRVPLQAQASGQGATSGQLGVYAPAGPLATTAVLGTHIGLPGVLLLGAPTQQILVSLAGAGAGQSALSAALTVTGAAPGLSGATVAQAVTSATLSAAVPLVGSVTGQGSSSLNLIVGLTGGVVAQASASGAPTTRFAGASVGQATASASLTVVGSLVGTVVAQGTATGGLSIGLVGLTNAGGSSTGVVSSSVPGTTPLRSSAVLGTSRTLLGSLVSGTPPDEIVVSLSGSTAGQARSNVSSIEIITTVSGVVQVSWIYFESTPVPDIHGSGDATGLPGDCLGHGYVINPVAPQPPYGPGTGGTTGRRPVRRPSRRPRPLQPVYGYVEARGLLGQAVAHGGVTVAPATGDLAAIGARGQASARGALTPPAVAGQAAVRSHPPKVGARARVLRPTHGKARAIRLQPVWTIEGRVLDCTRGAGALRATPPVALATGRIVPSPAWDLEELWLLGVEIGETDEELVLA